MPDTEVTIRPVALPHGPRDTMAKLRGHGRHALLESALPMEGQAEWSFIAGPAKAALYTDRTGTHLERAGRIERSWDDPFAALATVMAPPQGRVGAGSASSGAKDADARDASTIRAGAQAGAGAAVVVRTDGDPPPEGLDFVGGWVGALGYDAARFLHRLPARSLDDPALPAMWWMAVDQVLAFHHASGRWWHCTSRGATDGFPWSSASSELLWADTLSTARGPIPVRTSWHAECAVQRTDRPAFEAGVRTVRADIAAGAMLQVNLTRREDRGFDGDAWRLYEDLVAAHPAPFCAYIEGPGFAVASCSPERFLRVRGREVQARPIKGTTPRGRNADDDAAQHAWLAASAKNRAENLMIVDLMRNDLGRVAETGSVQVPSLFALEPYASVWQMVSTITARLQPGLALADLLRACWPPGSMTGAPKLAAVQAIEALEPLRRGFYAGSIGYLDCRGNMDLSVVIRSVVVAGGRAMLQLGGGIVADSDPPSEWDETVAKGERLATVLDRRG